MKKVLTSIKEPGAVIEVAIPGEEFEVHKDFKWIDCPHDDVTQAWIWTKKGSKYSFSYYDAATELAHEEDGWKEVRRIAYPSAEEQLGMIFDELKATGSISLDGDWATMVDRIKNDIPKNNPKGILDYYEKQRKISDQTMIDAGKADEVIKR